MITHKELKEILHYDPNTGIFTWSKKTCLKVVVGKKAGTLDDSGYILIAIKRKAYKAHRLAWFYVHGVWPEVIDHINHIRNDNRMTNLRDVTHAENQKNMSPIYKGGCGVRGVCWHKRDKVWQARIHDKNKEIYLGNFDDKFEAICSRMSANNKYKYHENHNR